MDRENIVYGKVTNLHHELSTVDVELPNGNTFENVIMAYPIGKNEKCFGYKQINIGDTVLILKSENSLIAFAQVSQSKDTKPNKKSETEISKQDVVKAFKDIKDMLDGIADSLKSLGVGLSSVGGDGSGGISGSASLKGALPKIDDAVKKIEALYKDSPC